MFKDKRYNEVLGVMIILISIILLLSLMSFTIQDRINLAENHPVENLMGPVGVYLSHALRYVFGFSSFFFVILLVAAGYDIIKYKRRNDILEHSFSMLFFMTSSTALLTLMSNKPYFQTGGITGHYICMFLSSGLGNTGSFIVILIFNLAGLILVGIVSISEVINNPKNIKEQIMKSIDKIKSLIKGKNRAPQNSIEEKLYSHKNKIPWITKKTMVLKFSDESESIKQSLKYLEMSLPTIGSTGKDQHYSENLLEQEKLCQNKYEINHSDTEEPENTYYCEAVIDDYKIELDDENDAVQKKYVDTLEDDVERIYKSEIIDTEDLNRKTDDENREKGPDKTPPYIEKRTNLKSSEKSIDPIKDISINENYIIPTDFLHSSKEQNTDNWKSEITKNSELLVNALADFGIESKVINVNRGPVITLYELQIAPGIKVNRIVGLADDIAMALAALRVRIVAPIPGKSAIGVEIPNGKREIVTLGDVLKSDEYHFQTGYLNVALGKDILGHPVTLDIKSLPHLLIAGATGSGKSVCVNSIITSLIYNYDPHYLKFILIDPKMVELQVYNGLPHLLAPVITESKMAQVALKWTIYEMERRYRLLSEYNCRNIERYNSMADSSPEEIEKLPYIVTIIDELADLIMVATKEVEGHITRIAQKARAVGIHLVLATQRPSVDVITGIIKANFPARIAFQVAQKTDSRTILDQNGAEKLLGQGDLLYQSPISSFPIRIQGTYVSEDEILNIVNHLGKLYKPRYLDITESVEETEGQFEENSEDDELFVEALKIVEETRKASASYLQRRLSIGYNRAARIIELMEDRGYVGPQQGSKPREVFI